MICDMALNKTTLLKQFENNIRCIALMVVKVRRNM
jgi:hypothetical protein